MKAEIIAVGNELLCGATENTNAGFLCRRLAMMGYDVEHMSVVGDVEQDIMDTVRIAVSRSELTILTGGLGPTADDMTKEAVAKAFGFQLVLHEPTEQKLRAFFAQRGTEMTENNLKQAMVIKGARVLDNPNGTAPGIFAAGKRQAVAILPGPPREMQPMFDNELRPLLQQSSGVKSASASLHVFGIGESMLETKLKDLLYSQNPTAALYAKTGEVHINLMAHGATQEEADKRLATKIAAIKARVGDYIYSEDGLDLNGTVVKLLHETRMKVATAESCTGGMLASALTDIAGASEVFEYGMVSYSDAVKHTALDVDNAVLRKYTAISSVTAAEMAKGAFQNGKADISVGITGLAGPHNGIYLDKPVGRVYIAVADKEKVIVKQFDFNAKMGRAYVREVCVKNALDMIRRFVLGLPVEGAKTFDSRHLADVENEGKPRKSNVFAVQRKVLTSLFCLVLLRGLAFGISTLRTRSAASVYDELRSTYAPNTSAAERGQVNLEALLKRNPDTVGWLWSDELNIDSVVTGGRDNEYYDTHDFNGDKSGLGCPHVAAGTDVTQDPDNIVIYGSSRDAAQTFGGLSAFTDVEFLKTSPLLHLKTHDGTMQYKIVSVFYANSDAKNGDVQDFYEAAAFEDTDAFKSFVVELKMRALATVNVSIVEGDRFLTLVTDSPVFDGAKLVVVGRMVREGEDNQVPANLITANMAPLYPTQWHEKNGTTSIVNEVVERDRWMSWIVDNERASGGADNLAGVTTDGVVAFEPNKAQEGDTIIAVLMSGEEMNDTPMSIVSRIVAYEMGENAPSAAVKAQAVATVTWLRNAYKTTGAPVVSGKTPTQEIYDLVAEVINEQMTYGGEVAYTPYFPISAGYTNACEEVWADRGSYPYLVSVRSAYDYLAEGYSRTASFNQSAMKARIEAYYGITLSEDSDNWIKVLDYTGAEYMKTVSIDGQLTVSGQEFAEQCLNLRSAYVSLSRNGSVFVFSVRGYGHGVGMSQAGARLYASQEGMDYHEILSHYYPGVSFENFEW